MPSSFVGVAIADWDLYKSVRETHAAISIDGLDITDDVEKWARAAEPQGKADHGLRILTSVADQYGLGNPWAPFLKLEQLALAGQDAFYRDHTLHTVRVFLLCYSVAPGDGKLLQAALLHDIGVLPECLRSILHQGVIEPYRGIFEELTGTGVCVEADIDILPVLASGIYFWLDRMSRSPHSPCEHKPLYRYLCKHYTEWLPVCIGGLERRGTHAFVSGNLYLKSALREFFADSPVPALDPDTAAPSAITEQQFYDSFLTAALVLFHDLRAGEPPSHLKPGLSALGFLVGADEIAEWGRASVLGSEPVVAEVREWELKSEPPGGGIAVAGDFRCGGGRDRGSGAAAGTGSYDKRTGHLADTILAKACNLVRAGVQRIHLRFGDVACRLAWFRDAVHDVANEYGDLCVPTRRVCEALTTHLSEIWPRTPKGRKRKKASLQTELQAIRFRSEPGKITWAVEEWEGALPFSGE